MFENSQLVIDRLVTKSRQLLVNEVQQKVKEFILLEANQVKTILKTLPIYDAGPLIFLVQ